MVTSLKLKLEVLRSFRPPPPPLLSSPCEVIFRYIFRIGYVEMINKQLAGGGLTFPNYVAQPVRPVRVYVSRRRLRRAPEIEGRDLWDR